jgi:hypothetical protein
VYCQRRPLRRLCDPYFFINGRRHYGAYDIATPSRAIRAARARAALATASVE